MYYSIIDAASLNNPTLLNELRQRKVIVKYEPESPSSAYHYNFLLEIDDNDINGVIKKIQNTMKESWYTFFWNKTTLFITFNTKQFQINIANGWSSDSYKSAQAFGRTQKIPEIYLDFKKYFQPYKENFEA